MKWIKLIYTIWKYWAQIKGILGQARDVATKVQAETGIDFGKALGGTLERVKDSIPKPHEMTPDEERRWMERHPTNNIG